MSLVALAELLVGILRLLVWLEVKQVIHFEGLLSALTHELLRPDEEDLGENVGGGLNRRVEGNTTVDFVFLFDRLLLHLLHPIIMISKHLNTSVKYHRGFLVPIYILRFECSPVLNWEES